MIDSASMGEPANVAVGVGGWTLGLHSQDRVFIELLRRHYAEFLCPPEAAQADFEIEIVAGRAAAGDGDVEVSGEQGRWMMRRGDFEACWNPRRRNGRILQRANPYSTDSVLRIVHSLHLAGCGGFLVHAASAIHRGHALLFSGVSGAGKTTLMRLAPSAMVRLTDEISYVRARGPGYGAYGTPFTGELNTPGANRAAPISALYFPEHARQHRIEPLAPAVAARKLMRNVLFFVNEPALTRELFRSVMEFVSAVPSFELAFAPEPSVWSLL
jgi:hypothetical protein